MALASTSYTISVISDGSSLLYFGTRSWTQSEVETYTATGYSDTWTNSLGVATRTGDTIWLLVTNTTKNKSGVLTLLVTTGSTASSKPTAVVKGYIQDGKDGEDATARTISIIASTSAILRNDRYVGSREYTFTAKVQNYETSKLRWYKDGSLISGTDGKSEISISVPYKGAEDMTVKVQISDDASAYDSVTLSVVDQTPNRTVFPVTDTVPTSTTYTENEVIYNYISGDSMTVNLEEVDPELPSEYKRCNYLESSGTQWIDTGFTVTPTNHSSMAIKLDALFTTTAKGNGWWANGLGGGGGHAFYVGIGNGSTYKFVYGDGYNDVVTSVYGQMDTRYTLTLDNIAKTYKISQDGTEVLSVTSSLNTPSYSSTLPIFCWKRANGDVGYCFSEKVYGYVLYQNGTPVRNFVPAIDPSNIPCMYDLVTGMAYYNSGSGTFSYGLSDSNVKSTIYVFNGTSWQILDKYFNDYESIMLDNLPSVFGDLDENVNHTVANQGGTLYDFFKQIIAEHISAVFYHVGRVIYGGDIDKNDSDDPADWDLSGKGFIMRSNGSVEINNATFDNCTITTWLNMTNEDGTASAEIKHPSLTTVPAGSEGTGCTQDYNPVAWKLDTAKATISANTILNYTGTFNSTTNFTKVANITNNEGLEHDEYQAYYYYGTSTVIAGGGTVSYNFTIEHGGSCYFDLRAGSTGEGSIGNEIRFTIYVNGASKWTDSYSTSWGAGAAYFSTTLSLNAGDSVRIDCYYKGDYNGSDRYLEVTAQRTTFADLGLKNGFQYYANSSWNVLSSEFYEVPLIIKNTSGTVIFDSSTDKKYQKPTTFVGYSSASSNSVYALTSDSYIYYNGTDASHKYTAQYFSRSSSTAVSITLSNGSVVSLSSSTYAFVYGYIKTAKSEAGVQTKSIYPVAGNTYDLGSTETDSSGVQKKWRNVYASSFSGNLSGQVARDSGGAWIKGRDNATVRQTRQTTSSGSSWNPVCSVKTASGNWTMGNVGDNYLRFSYDTDANYSAGTNNAMTSVYITETGAVHAVQVWGAVAN